jgi:hypothetical protein
MFESIDKDVLYKLSQLNDRSVLSKDTDLAPMLACLDSIKSEFASVVDSSSSNKGKSLEVSEGIDSARRILMNIFAAT